MGAAETLPGSVSMAAMRRRGSADTSEAIAGRNGGNGWLQRRRQPWSRLCGDKCVFTGRGRKDVHGEGVSCVIVVCLIERAMKMIHD